MSEKAKTEALEKIQAMCTGMATCYERLCDAEVYPIAKQALSEPPDVVVLLRWLREWQDTDKPLLGNTPIELTDDDKILIGILDRAIQRKFHVRLTDDGWEWVEGGGMKVGGYLLDLCCDTEGCDAAKRHGIRDSFSGHNKGDCIRQAKRVGWHVGYKHQYCPCCTGKRVYESDLESQTMTFEELQNIRPGPFTYKRKEIDESPPTGGR